MITVFGIKKELERRNIKVIIVNNGVLNEHIKKHMKCPTIEEETNGKVDGYGNLGFTANKNHLQILLLKNGERVILL